MLTADELQAVVRVHADRVHDAVRRLGCGPQDAVRVVEVSARELIDAVAHRPETVGDPVGWWFARARALGRRAAGGDESIPVGGGVLGADAHQLRLAEALEALPERERAALLLRDSYDLPASAVGTVLSLDAANAMEVVGQARLALLPLLTETRAPRRGDHPSTLGPLARLAEGGQVAAEEGGTRRHVHGCTTCTELLENQERARRLLAGLTVVAMPDADRERLLTQTQAGSLAVLPAAPAPTWAEQDEDEPGHHYSVSLILLGLLVAGGIGTGIGALASRGNAGTPFVQQGPVALVTSAPVLRAGPTTPLPTLTPDVSPSPHVFVVTPSPTPTPSATASPTSNPGVPLEMQLDPTTGTANTQITVTGQGFTPGATIDVTFHNAVGNGSGTTSSTVADAGGSFVTTLLARDSGFTTAAGPHPVTADDGTHHAQATFTVT